MRLTIGRKLGLGFGVVVSLSVATAGLVYTQVRSVADEQARVLEVLVPSAKLAYAIEGGLDATLAYHRGFMLLKDEAQVERRDNAWRKIDSAYTALAEQAQHWTPGEATDAVGELGTVLDRFRVAQQRAIDFARAGNDDAAKAACANEVVPPAQRAGELAELIIKRKAGDLDDASAALETQTAYVVKTVLFASGLAGLLSLVLAVLITRSITGPLRQVITRVGEIAEGDGDLTQRVDDTRKDELGELGAKVNTFIQKIHDIIFTVRAASHDVASAATEIAASSEQMAASMTQQTQRVGEIRGAVDEMGRAVVDIAQKAAQASNVSGKAGESARQGGEVVEQTIDDMNSISGAVSASARSVEELGKRGEQIGQIVAVINDIADQTNLLALNAAIEAARAGEHGRGFAVVADEVRKLADRTTGATKEIADSIRAIQQETGEAVERMNAGTRQVTEGVARAGEAGRALREIVGGAGEVEAMIHSIAAATEEQSATAEQINRSVEMASAAIREAADGAAQSSMAVTGLSQKAEELQTMIGRFKLADHARR